MKYTFYFFFIFSKFPENLHGSLKKNKKCEKLYDILQKVGVFFQLILQAYEKAQRTRKLTVYMLSLNSLLV